MKKTGKIGDNNNNENEDLMSGDFSFFETPAEDGIKKIAKLTKTAADNNYSFIQDVDSSALPNVGKAPILYIDPMFDPILFLFPKDRIDEINKRLRHYYETNPIVGSAIDLHSSIPITDFHLECLDKNNKKYWNDWKDRVGLIETLRQLIHDYWLLGEAIGIPIWDPYNQEISHFNQYPPENIDIVQTYVTPKKFFLLKPDPKLSEKLRSNDGIDAELVRYMDPKYIESIKNNKPYLLGDSDKVIYLARTTTKYRSRGISILSRCLKDLLYMDKLRLLQITFVDRHLFPLKIFKLGSEQHKWIPSKKHFVKLKQILAANQSDPSFNIIWNFGLSVDYVGTHDKIANLIPEFEWAIKQVMAGLFVNEEIIHGGLPSTVRDTTSMRTLMQRYNDVREKIERMLITHVFLPVARARRMYKKSAKDYFEKLEKRASDLYYSIYKKSIKKGDIAPHDIYVKANSGLIDISAFDIPRPIWKRINIFNNLTEQQYMMQLENEGKIPLSVVLEMLGLDPEAILEKLKEQESTRFDSVYREIKSELAKSEEIRSQVLAGKKVEEWIAGNKVTPAPSSGGGLGDLFGGGGGLGSGPSLPPMGGPEGMPPISPIETSSAPEVPTELPKMESEGPLPNLPEGEK